MLTTVKSNQSRVTLTQVAKQAKVSIATVSQVLNRKDNLRVAEQTRQRILQVADQMGYRPDPRYRLMGRQRTSSKPDLGQIGFLVPVTGQGRFVSEQYYMRLFGSMLAEAQLHSQSISIIPIASDDYLPRAVMDHQIDAAIVSETVSHSMVLRIAEQIPTVLVNIHHPELPISAVTADEAGASVLAMNHLRELGHRQIVFFYIADNFCWHHKTRCQSFEKIVTQSGGYFTGSRAVVLSNRDKSLFDVACEQLKQWQTENKMPTAIVCAADCYAIAFLEAAEHIGIRVPDQLSVIGMNDIQWCEHTRPRLTSIRQPMDLMGQAAVKYVNEQIQKQKKDTTSFHQQYPITLCIRQSTGAVPVTK